MESGAERDVVLKIHGPDSNPYTVSIAKQFDTAREADFYNYILSLPDEQRMVLRDILPAVYFAESDWKTADKAIIMEDFSKTGIVSNLYMGSQFVMNKGKDIA